MTNTGGRLGEDVGITGHFGHETLRHQKRGTRHFGPGPEVSGHFVTKFVVLKCLVAEVSGSRCGGRWDGISWSVAILGRFLSAIAKVLSITLNLNLGSCAMAGRLIWAYS